jgi:[acyl-carrier-protein] S-malonyltransferase
MKNTLSDRVANAAFVFRGYNVTNLGRSDELLAHPTYGPTVEKWLREASEICADATHKHVDLVARVRQKQETTLETYTEAISIIISMELAQLDLLEEFFGIRYADAKLSFGYSLGEIGALVAGGVFEMKSALQIPLSMADDCVELGRDTTLGVVFSRGPALDLDAVHWLCLRINSEGHGVVGISSYLSPNTILLLGQGKTIDRFAETMNTLMPKGVHLRKNEYHWPPLHTPIMWERHIPNRAAMQMHAMAGGFKAPQPPVLSLVTGKTSYNDYNAREILIRWIDHPQRLWDAVYETFSQGIDTVIHVGPEPNLVPATFTRVAENVRGQLAERSLGGFGLRAVSRAVRRPWLSKLLPTRSALLRAPFVEQIVLEDWLLAQQ